MLFDAFHIDDEWPPEAEEIYERVEELGRGSFGVVWMARRIVPPEDEYDDEYVALKNIEIKAEKSYTYAAREISILRELRHPNVIRLIRAFDIFEERSQLVALQLARGPDLQYLVSNRGALGLPLARLVARHLIAAVSYLHGRAVIHRDIKPTNCILENTHLRGPDQVYDWLSDDAIWSDGPNAEAVIASNKWKLMLVDFGFARALDVGELVGDKEHRRNSIVNERMRIEEVAEMVARELHDAEEIEKCTAELREDVEKTRPSVNAAHRLSMVSISFQELSAVGEISDAIASELEKERHPVSPKRAARASVVASVEAPESVPENSESPQQNRRSLHAGDLRANFNRQSSARTKIRGMSALGTKAYAAPEIKHDLRNKTEDDINMSREALTECVADYGMLVDSYSVGWTLRVILTGVPPNKSVSSYMGKIGYDNRSPGSNCLWCCRSKLRNELPNLRDTCDLPIEAAHLINSLTKRNVEERMTVREAQSHPYIKGLPEEEPYQLPVGDIPAKHGDPVVPLRCAASLK